MLNNQLSCTGQPIFFHQWLMHPSRRHKNVVRRLDDQYITLSGPWWSCSHRKLTGIFWLSNLLLKSSCPLFIFLSLFFFFFFLFSFLFWSKHWRVMYWLSNLLATFLCLLLGCINHWILFHRFSCFVLILLPQELTQSIHHPKSFHHIDAFCWSVCHRKLTGLHWSSICFCHFYVLCWSCCYRKLTGLHQPL